MTRSWKCVLAGWLYLAAIAGCAGRSHPVPAPGPGARTTIIIGATRLDPNDVTIAASDLIGFSSTAGNPLQVEFVQPDSQAGKITCRVIDPAELQRGEKPWAEFRMNEHGHLTAYIPPGLFPSACSFAPGRYAYRVRELDADMRPLEEKLGQLGSITVKER
jgi:hypothetical protein